MGVRRGEADFKVAVLVRGGQHGVAVSIGSSHWRSACNVRTVKSSFPIHPYVSKWRWRFGRQCCVAAWHLQLLGGRVIDQRGAVLVRHGAEGEPMLARRGGRVLHREGGRLAACPAGGACVRTWGGTVRLPACSVQQQNQCAALRFPRTTRRVG